MEPAGETSPVGGVPPSAGMSEQEALAVLVGVDGLGPATLGRLLASVGNAGRLLALAAGPGGRSALHEAAQDHVTRTRLEPEVVDRIIEAAAGAPRFVERTRDAGLRLVALGDPEYPPRLRQVELPPHLLFVAGDPLALSAERAVAVVGTRRPTDDGRRLAARIGAILARSGAAVVSGLAVGIDGAAHAAVVEVGGSTIAVLGGGHRHLYPRAHARLADAIASSGGAVVSEFAPEVAPTPGMFPRRNRLISGLSEATIVIEAGARSGALTTAAWALEQGRGCFLVPGGIEAPMSAGCLAFLRECPAEARIVAGIPQLLEDLGLTPGEHALSGAGRGERGADARVRGRARPRPPGSPAIMAALGMAEGRVAAALLAGLSTVDELVASADLPVAAVLAALTLLEGRGLVAGAYGRYRPLGQLAGAR